MEAASTRARSTDHATTLREALKATVMDTDTGEAVGDISDKSVVFSDYDLKCVSVEISCCGGEVVRFPRALVLVCSTLIRSCVQTAPWLQPR